MRQARIFGGSSYPQLVEAICNRVGAAPAKAHLGKFSNGETRVEIHTSVRDQDVFIVQSGCEKINDAVMELLIMISACTSGSAKSITAVLPYFPYSRMSKKKSHRGAITARMLANLLQIAGVSHIITLDLHAGQMQGFFHCPVDNLVAEPLIAYWVKHNVPEWKRAVVVSKNPGGTKRVTSLADALKISFGIVMTDRTRPGRSNSGLNSMSTSVILDKAGYNGATDPKINGHSEVGKSLEAQAQTSDKQPALANIPIHARRQANSHPSPLGKNMENQISDLHIQSPKTCTATGVPKDPYEGEDDDDDDDEDNNDDEPRDIVTGRLKQGHIVDDDAQSPSFSPTSSNNTDDPDTIPENMLSSTISITSQRTAATARAGLGGSADAGDSSDEEDTHLKNPEQESTVTLVGNVRGRPVIIVDDMIDKATSWIAAAETVVKRGGATKVYCMATHGIFGDNCLAEMQECDYIEKVIVTNALPIAPIKCQGISKLVQLDVAPLLAEAIRRNKHGESVSNLFLHYD